MGGQGALESFVFTEQAHENTSPREDLRLISGWDSGNSKETLLRKWKVKGSYSISTDRELFYFKFNQDEDRKQVLEAYPIVIAGKLFVIRQWFREVEAQKTKITSIPIWVKLMDLPKEL
ncbi:hypothetical protein IFM89_012905 [Coptis chinensis]|uniref:DUF4283 domain-containing protein n=1 Tax=Coptis chinensis TaxID=261450 RepID=A0A835HCE7_9MAGN|nr:hypothetical protein IFM89_012905 [Coptis chinensis]